MFQRKGTKETDFFFCWYEEKTSLFLKTAMGLWNEFLLVLRK